MKLLKFVPLLTLVLVLTSCYHAQIITNAKPSDQVLEEEWAASFVFGLVPPKEVTTASQCPNGVAKVETEISFLNGLVSALTLNIFTPMHIKVTCAAGTGMSSLNTNTETNLSLPQKSGSDKIIETVQEASEVAVTTKKPVFIQFR